MKEKTLLPKIYTEEDKANFIVEAQTELYFSLFKNFEYYVDEVFKNRFQAIHQPVHTTDYDNRKPDSGILLNLIRPYIDELINRRLK